MKRNTHLSVNDRVLAPDNDLPGRRDYERRRHGTGLLALHLDAVGEGEGTVAVGVGVAIDSGCAVG